MSAGFCSFTLQFNLFFSNAYSDSVDFVENWDSAQQVMQLLKCLLIACTQFIFAVFINAYAPFVTWELDS